VQKITWQFACSRTRDMGQGKIIAKISPFKKWMHLHKFRNIDGKQTEIIDEIEFELPYGILRKLFEGYAYKQLQNIFESRKIATVKELENN
jgi:ligand-binding SRPBCC domain-containing protein